LSKRGIPEGLDIHTQPFRFLNKKFQQMFGDCAFATICLTKQARDF
jgi:hypothetical protein